MNGQGNIATAVIIGTGNMGSVLSTALKNAGIGIAQVMGQQEQNAKVLAEKLGTSYTTSLNYLDTTADLYLISIPDDVVGSFSETLPELKGIIAHTSGTVALADLNGSRTGVFYPLQTVNKSSQTDLSAVPICIEGITQEVTATLGNLAGRISSDVRILSSAQREKVHLAAVMTNNFSNHLFDMAHNYLESHNIRPDILNALIAETARKAVEEHPRKVQTGPARRGDKDTINKHLALLKEDFDLKKIYTLFTDSIARRHNET